VEQDCKVHVSKKKNPKQQEMARCVGINGIPSTMITKKNLITTKVRATTPPTRSITRGS
jgi:hypothetical protein